MPSLKKTKFGRKAIEDAKSIGSSNKEIYLRIIIISTIHIPLNCLNTSLTLPSFFKSKEMEENLIEVKHKQPIVDEGRIYKGITIKPSIGSKPQKVILEKLIVGMKKTHSMSSLQEEPHKRFIIGKYLKKYFPTMWEMLDITQRIRSILRLIKTQ